MKLHCSLACGLAAGLALLSCSGTAAAPVQGNVLPPVKVVPWNTGVLLLPSVDTEPWAAHVAGQRHFVVLRRQEFQFISRHFKVYGESMAAQAADVVPKIDLNDPAARTAENMDALAKRTGADWVVSINVQEVMQDAPQVPDDGNFHCHCRVELKVWDAREHGWRFDAPYIGHDSGGSLSPVFLFMEAIGNAADGCLARFLDGYPKTVPIVDDGHTFDYLAGQTKPVVGDPNVPFTALKPL